MKLTNPEREQALTAKQRRALQDRTIRPNEKHIQMFMHCRLCLESVPPGQSPATYARLAVGWTPLGLQVWCERHDVNVLHVDFEGFQHPGDTSRKAAP